MHIEHPSPAGPRPADRLQADQALRDERFRLLVQGVKDYAIFMLDPGGRIICWNTGAEFLFGYREADVIDRNYSLFFTPEDVGRGEPEKELEAAGGAAGRFEGERLRVRKDGSSFLANVVISPVRRDGAGTLLGFAQITRDVTESKRVEERLRQSHRLEAVGALAAGVAHDFNNLLMVINGYSDILLATMHEHDRGRPEVQQISKAGGRAAALTRQLLAFGRKQVLAPRALSLNAHLADLDPLLRKLLGGGVEFATHLAGDVRAIKFDPSQIDQVIINLAVNARDAMPAGGRLSVRTANVELGVGPEPLPAEVSPGPYVMLEVSDTGCGMDGPTQARIFEPFFTTKGAGGGTGLGLATVYGIVKQSGGHIDVASRLGAGATFRVYLPSADGPAHADEPGGSSPDVPGGGETLLLVEDEAGIRELARFLLLKGGYTVLVASDGAEAVEVGTCYQGEIHLLITDVVMPGANGLQAAHRLTALRPGLKVLFISGYSEDAVTQQGMLRPGAPFLEKPFSHKALAAKVRQVLDG